MSGPHPAVAAVRLAVRRALADMPVGTRCAVAFSGGADSLALLAAATFERPGGITALVVDQRWHVGSVAATDTAAAVAERLGAHAEVLVAPAPRVEAAARAARYAALDDAAVRLDIPVVLLGHTCDDQAETVLLALARGSGARSLAGMASRRDRYRRPLLEVGRATTLAACAAQGLEPYVDPANADRAFARVRVRQTAMPALAAALGHDVAVNLSRTARLLRDDADLLDRLAAAAAADCAHSAGGLDVAALRDLPPALRRRVLHGIAPGLTSFHVDALDCLVTDWHGQGPVALPSGIRAQRTSGRIHLVPPRSRDEQTSP